MRRVLVDYARSRGYVKGGGEVCRVDLDEGETASLEPESNLVALDDALRALAGVDQRKADVIELSFFGGLTVEETAEVLQVSPDTPQILAVPKRFLEQFDGRKAKVVKLQQNQQVFSQ